MDRELEILNDNIICLFHRMIKSWDKIVDVQDGYIKFDNGLSITAIKKDSKRKTIENGILSLDSTTFSKSFAPIWWDVVIPDTDKLIFHIVTPYKTYTVPEITDRHEYAEVLNILDDSLKKFEEMKISVYLKHFENEIDSNREIFH